MYRIESNKLSKNLSRQSRFAIGQLAHYPDRPSQEHRNGRGFALRAHFIRESDSQGKLSGY